MSWRPYVIVKGKRELMRDTTLYPTKEKAIAAIKRKNKKWMELNYTKSFAKNSNFTYGAIQVPKSGYKYPKGAGGNKTLLKSLKKYKKCSHCKGTGYHGKTKCPACKGTGKIWLK